MRRSLAAVLAVVLSACLNGCASPGVTVAPSATSTLGTVRHVIRVVAGPVCPVVTPNSTGCDDRPVPDAEFVVRSASGVEVSRFRSDANGLATVALPPGDYLLEPQPVPGLMGTAPPIELTVMAGAAPRELVVTYDTGIR